MVNGQIAFLGLQERDKVRKTDEAISQWGAIGYGSWV